MVMEDKARYHLGTISNKVPCLSWEAPVAGRIAFGEMLRAIDNAPSPTSLCPARLSVIRISMLQVRGKLGSNFEIWRQPRGTKCVFTMS